MEDCPYSHAWGRGWQRQRRCTEIQRDFRRKDRYDHLDEERHCNQTSHEPGKQQQTAEDLKAGDKVGCKVRERHTQFHEAADALVGIDKFQDPLPQEHCSGHQSEEQSGFRTRSWGLHKPCQYIFHDLYPFNAAETSCLAALASIIANWKVKILFQGESDWFAPMDGRPPRPRAVCHVARCQLAIAQWNTPIRARCASSKRLMRTANGKSRLYPYFPSHMDEKPTRG